MPYTKLLNYIAIEQYKCEQVILKYNPGEGSAENADEFLALMRYR